MAKPLDSTCCCPLCDFAGKSLHHKVSRTDFKLRLNRTEVVRRPATTTSYPTYPLRRRYTPCNYTLEGIESGNPVDLVPITPVPDVPDDDILEHVTQDVEVSTEVHDFVVPLQESP